MPIQTIDSVPTGAMRELHVLKCDSDPFEAVLSGTKPFEIRRDDRPFAAGDLLVLRELVRGADDVVYTGRALVRRVTCVMRDCYGLPEGLCAMGLEAIDGIGFAPFLYAPFLMRDGRPGMNRR